MNKVKLLLWLLCTTSYITSQDTIQLRSGEKIISKVISIESNKITFHKYSNLNGPIYEKNKNKILCIKYKNGLIDTFENTNKSCFKLPYLKGYYWSKDYMMYTWTDYYYILLSFKLLDDQSTEGNYILEATIWIWESSRQLIRPSENIDWLITSREYEAMKNREKLEKENAIWKTKFSYSDTTGIVDFTYYYNDYDGYHFYGKMPKCKDSNRTITLYFEQLNAKRNHTKIKRGQPINREYKYKWYGNP